MILMMAKRSKRRSDALKLRLTCGTRLCGRIGVHCE